MRKSVAHSSPARALPATGFCLLENLVALAIVMLTVLGTARQFGEALRMMRDNTDMRNAVTLGEDVVDRIAAFNVRVPPNTSFNCIVGKTRCFADKFIESQINAWHRLLVRDLPDARAGISVAETPTTRIFSVVIEWLDRRNQASVREFEIVLRK